MHSVPSRKSLPFRPQQHVCYYSSLHALVVISAPRTCFTLLFPSTSSPPAATLPFSLLPLMSPPTLTYLTSPLNALVGVDSAPLTCSPPCILFPLPFGCYTSLPSASPHVFTYPNLANPFPISLFSSRSCWCFRFSYILHPPVSCGFSSSVAMLPYLARPLMSPPTLT